MNPAAQAGTPARTLVPALARIPGHLFWRAAARVGEVVADVLPPGVDIHAYAALLALGQDEAASQQQVADAICVSRTTMTKVAAGLVDQDLVERVRNPADRRSYALRRTAEGGTAARAWRHHVDGLADRLGSGFTEAEHDELRRLLLVIARPWLPADTLAELVDSLGFLITRIHVRMHAEVTAALRPLDLEPRHLGSLVMIEAGPVSQADLARTLGVSGPTVVEIADHLERRGLVQRRRLPNDRRTQVLELLPGAAETADEARRIGLATSAAMLTSLSAAEHESLLELLARFVTAG